jgi:putative ABC transport system substrate-binding protein
MKANMKLRAWGVVLLVAGILLMPFSSSAEPPAKLHRIGLIGTSATSSKWRTLANYQAFLDGLRQFGYMEGQNLVIEWRSAEGKPDRLPQIAAELVQLKPEIILVATCGAPLDAVRRATNTIPIVVAACTGDMVAAGIVASLARPGGNITGQQKLNPELAAKRLQLLKEAVPKVSRVAVLWDPGYSDYAADWRALRAAAQALGVTLQSVEVRGPAELETGFSVMAAERAEALITFADSLTYVYAQRLAELAAKSSLPATYAYHEIADAGGLMSYGPNIPDMFRHSVVFVDKILKGAKPADLPVEQPTHFELVVNLKTAKALGLTIPQSILVRADKVIE